MESFFCKKMPRHALLRHYPVCKATLIVLYCSVQMFLTAPGVQKMDWSKKNIYGKVGSMRQLASVRRAVLDDGKSRNMRIVDVNNGSGLSFTVYPDRGMDIGECSFCGIPLVWLTPETGGPEFYESEKFNWLRSWGGGLLTGCGLLNVGGPGEYDGENHGLHGRVSHLPGRDVNTDSRWENDRFLLEVSGKVHHSKVFGENLLLTRKISTALGDNSITIEDSVENLGYAPSPFMQLYHMNFSYPLVDENSYLTATEHQIVPKDDHSASGISQWDKITSPVPGFAEQLFYHYLPADENGMAKIKLVNPDLKIALQIAYRSAELPLLAQWKQLGQGEYVIGLEPANCLPEGHQANIDKGMLKTIAPGEIVNHKIIISVEKLS